MIERHIEKIVLAVCLLALMVAVWQYLPSSPRRIDVIAGPQASKDALPPDQVDQALREAARTIDQRIRQAEPKAYALPDYSDSIVRLSEQPAAASDQFLEFGSPRVELEGTLDLGPQQKVTLKQLLDVIPEPGKPVVRVEREYARKAPEPEDVLAGHVAATYPWQDLIDQWEEQLKETPIRGSIVVADVEVEVRELRPDGTWSAPRPVQTVRLPIYDTAGRPVAVPTVPEYDGNNAEQVLRSVQALASVQQGIIQPNWWDIWWSTHQWGDWKVNLPDNPISAKAAEAGMTGDTPARGTPMMDGFGGSPMPGDGFGGSPMPGGGFGPAPATPTPRTTVRSRTTTRTPTRTTRTRQPTRRTAPPGGGFGGSPMPGGGFGGSPMPGGGFGGPTTPRRTTPTRTTRTPRERPVRVVPEPEPIEMPEPKPVPALSQQIQDGEVLVWAHDIGLKTLKTYQYRVRMVVVNPLITFGEDVEDPQDARQPLIRTPFSRWSDPLNVPQETEFFVTGHSEPLQVVNVEVFTRSQGQWVSKRFKVTEGSPIGEKSTVEVTNPADGSRESSEVDFATGAVAVQFDFDKTVRKGQSQRQTVEMVYLNENGQLRTRVRAIDEASQRYQQLMDEARRARAVTTAETPSFR